jgi:hypothetical protein
MSKFVRKITRLAKPRMSRVAKPRGIPRLGAAPTAPRLGIPRAPASPAGLPRVRRRKQAVDIHIRNLRAAGWRVRNGGWPTTRKAEALWDFCRPGETFCIR